MIRKGKVKRKTGKNLATILSKSLAKDYYTAVIEVGSNSYDADSENFKINLNTIDDYLMFEDDGLGMDEKGIEDFYRMGDSEKIDNPMTPKGRNKIGKFGIATILLEYLGNSYVLETWKNSKEITIMEKFGKQKQIKTNIEDCDSKLHGTKITITKLNFNQDNLKLDPLKTALQWQLPCLPDFDIYLNNVLVPKRDSFKFNTEYAVDEFIEGIGNVTGSIYYIPKTKVYGIFTYVNGRAVGNPISSDIENVKYGFSKKLLGIINADGLKKYVSFDRSRLLENNTHYIDLKKKIMKIINSISRDSETYVSRLKLTHYDKFKTQKIMKYLKSAESKLNKVFMEDKDFNPFRLEFKLDEEINWLSKYEKKKV